MGVDCCQPRTRTSPSRASRPAAMRSGPQRRRASVDQLGLFDHHVPSTARVTPRAKAASRASKRAQAAAKLDLRAKFRGHGQDGLQGGGVGRVGLVEGAIQVDHVQPFCAGGQPAPGCRGRVAAVGGLAGGVAFLQADHLTGAQVDGGINGEGGRGVHSLKKFSRMVWPTRWLFSG